MKKAKWWHVVIIGSLVSIIVEFLQFYYKRGLCEFEDCLHNAIGCLIGVMLIRGLSIMYNVIYRR